MLAWRQTNRRTDRQTDRQIDRQRDRQTRQTDKQTNRKQTHLVERAPLGFDVLSRIEINRIDLLLLLHNHLIALLRLGSCVAACSLGGRGLACRGNHGGSSLCRGGRSWKLVNQ
jgi:hypothetical protein